MRHVAKFIVEVGCWVILGLAITATCARAHEIQFDRGSRCHDQLCWNLEHMKWQMALAQADGRYAHRIANMLAKWTLLGFPEDGFIEKKYLKIHNEFLTEVEIAGNEWLFETQGYDRATERAIENNLVNVAEAEIDNGVVSSWLYQKGF